ncbi:MAG TPA: arsenite S-adenosylmethyltransferase, partial [Candidatus Limnocylindria bacterium]
SFGEYEAGLRDAGLTDVSVTSTHTVTDGMHSAIIRATKPADAPTRAATLVSGSIAGREELALAGGCCGGEGCC